MLSRENIMFRRNARSHVIASLEPVLASISHFQFIANTPVHANTTEPATMCGVNMPDALPSFFRRQFGLRRLNGTEEVWVMARLVCCRMLSLASVNYNYSQHKSLIPWTILPAGAQLSENGTDQCLQSH